MTLLMVRNALAECGDNQSLAARRLGISRTTLWRYMSRMNDMDPHVNGDNKA